MRFSLNRKRREAPNRSASGLQKSLALKKVLPEESETLRVLDLGAAHPTNLEFFSRYGGQLTIADLYRAFVPARASTPTTDEAARCEVFDRLLPYEPDTRFDLILAWDILNYLTRDELSLLMESLDRFCMPGTLVHALVATTREIPMVPQLYRVEDEETFAYDVPKGRTRPCPRYLEPQLVKLMPGLVVESRFQLRNGMLEYLFSYRASQRTALSAPRETAGRPSYAPFVRTLS